jgi:hypothetical protein
MGKLHLPANAAGCHATLTPLIILQSPVQTFTNDLPGFYPTKGKTNLEENPRLIYINWGFPNTIQPSSDYFCRL